VRLFRARAPGRFEEVAGFPVDNSFSQLLHGDLDGDGYGDLVTLASNHIYVVYLRPNIEASQQTVIALNRDPTCGSLAGTLSDVNGDGKQELLVADQCLLEMQTWTHLTGGNLTVLRLQSIAALAGSIAFGDLSGDGRVDFVVPRVPGFPTNPDELLVYKQAANGTFAFSQALPSISGFSAVGDVSSDGRGDLVAVRSPEVTVYRQNSSGNLVVGESFDALSSLEAIPRFGDLDGDGRTDLLLGASPNAASLVLGMQQPDASFRFFTLPGRPFNGEYGSVFAADFDGDGRADLLRGRGNASEVGFAIRLQIP
jgi:hypothetical protein